VSKVNVLASLSIEGAKYVIYKKREIAWGELLEKFMLNALSVGITD
jgi:hypothetical protein